MAEKINYVGLNSLTEYDAQIKEYIASASPQADFSQNDETASDYIKNRTHWAEEEIEELIPEMTFITAELSGPAMLSNDPSVVLIEGDTYIVKLNGVEYELVCTNQSIEGPGVFALMLMDETNSLGIGYAPEGSDFSNVLGFTGIFIEYDGSIEEATVSVFHKKETVHHLDSKYIPSQDWSANENENGYILNRTHWGSPKVIYSGAADFESGSVPIPIRLNLREGNTYIIKFNGIDFQCICQHFPQNDILAIGNISYMYDDHDDSMEPFLIEEIPEYLEYAAGAPVMFTTYEGPATFSIIDPQGDIHKLDNKYLDLDWLPIHKLDEKVILNPTEVTVGETIEDLSYMFVDGVTYIVCLQDVASYRLTAKTILVNVAQGQAVPISYIGNGSILSAMLPIAPLEDTGEEFIILSMFTDGGDISCTLMTRNDISLNSPISISISQVIDEINKLPNKYLNLDWIPEITMKEVEVLPETEIVETTYNLVTIRPNTTYILYDNDERYEIQSETIVTDDGQIIYYIGNLGMLDDIFPMTTEHYLFATIVDSASIAVFFDGQSHTISLYAYGEQEYSKLPNDFLDLAWLPIYKEEEVLIMPEYVMGTNGMDRTDLITTSTFTTDDVIIVYYNDTRYETKYIAADGSNCYIGDYYGINFPFHFLVTTTGSLISAIDEDAAISVYKKTDNMVPNKIPAEFLPDDIGGGIETFHVTVRANSVNSYIADKTMEEIIEAYNDGKLLYCNFILPIEEVEFIFPIVNDQIMPEQISFGGIVGNISYVIVISSDNSVMVNFMAYPTYDEVRLSSDLENYYLKSETYSQSEIDSRISTIPKFSIKVVTALPTSDISETTVYLVSSGDETNNLYTEYIYVDGKWEVLGGQELDLSGYVTETAQQTAIDNVAKTIPTYLLNGSKPGSLRVNTSAIEDDSYKIGTSAASFGDDTKASGHGSFAIGYGSVAAGTYSYSEGWFTESTNDASHAEGYYTDAMGVSSHAEGYYTKSNGDYSHAEGHDSRAIGTASHAEGYESQASGRYSHAEGHHVFAVGTASHAEGHSNIVAYTLTSEDFPEITDPITINGSTAYGDYSHVEGDGNIAYGESSHAEGTSVKAFGVASHAEGELTVASGRFSHAEGRSASAIGDYSHAEGYVTYAAGLYSHAEGYNTYAASESQHVQGKSNILDRSGTYAHIVGNGDLSKRSNAHTLDWNGNAEFQGDVKANACGGENPISLVDLYSTVQNILTSLLPTVTTADNGKVLMVVDGKWTIASLPAATDEQVDSMLEEAGVITA